MNLNYLEVAKNMMFKNVSFVGMKNDQKKVSED